mgnify:FL=1
MKKFIIGIMALALMALLLGNVYAQAPVKYVPVKYVKPVPQQRVVTWTWTYTCPYHPTRVVVAVEPVYAPAPPPLPRLLPPPPLP